MSTSDPGSVTTGRQPPDQVPEEIPMVSDEALRFIDSIGKESSCLYKGQRFAYIKPGMQKSTSQLGNQFIKKN